MMKTIAIYPQDIIPNAKYMHDAEGRMDLLGQIFYTGYGIRVPVKTRTPQDLDSPLSPFTRLIRRYCLTLTPVCQAILDLASLPGKKQIAEANKLLEPYNILLVIADEVTAEKILAAKPTNLPKLELGKDLTGSFYQCDACESTTPLSGLVVNSTEDEDELAHFCPHCWTQVADDKQATINQHFPTLLQEKTAEQERRSCVTNIRDIDSKYTMDQLKTKWNELVEDMNSNPE